MPIGLQIPSLPDPTQQAQLRREESSIFAKDMTSMADEPTKSNISDTPRPIDPLDDLQSDVSSFLAGTDPIQQMDQPQPQFDDVKKKALEMGYTQEAVDKYSPTPKTSSMERTRGVSQAFGNPNPRLYGPGGWNRGADIPLPKGTLQSAPPSGRWVVDDVDTRGWNTGWGRNVVIKNIDTGETLRRSHLDKVFVRPGQQVTGKPLGSTGRTGRSTGYHADVEMTNPQGRLVDYTKSSYYRGR